MAILAEHYVDGCLSTSKISDGIVEAKHCSRNLLYRNVVKTDVIKNISRVDCNVDGAIEVKKLFVTPVLVKAGESITKVRICTGATTATLNHSWIGIYSSSGDLLVTSSDKTSLTINTIQEYSISFSFSSTGIYLVAILIDGTGPPSLLGNTSKIARDYNGKSSGGYSTLPIKLPMLTNVENTFWLEIE